MEVGEVLKGIRWSAKAGGPLKVRIGGVSGRGRGPTNWVEKARLDRVSCLLEITER